MPTIGLRFSSTVVCAVLAVAIIAPASAATRHRHGVYATGVHYAHVAPRGGGYQALVSDGPGTGFGFHRLPGPYRVGAAIHRDRQSAAVRDAVITDAVTHGAGPYGFYGDSVYANGNRANYGVFSGSDAYGTPYFAGYYGPGDGQDFGPFGHAYTN